MDYDKNIICNGDTVSINWDKVVNCNHAKALRLTKGFNTARDRRPTLIVTHWDVCLSSEQCFEVLDRNEISSHFSVDNDGTIYQYLDTTHIAWHAGVKAVNRASIGIDLSNGFHLKRNEKYKELGFGLRPIVQATINGRKTGRFLGFYPVQVAAYKELLRTLCCHYEIPFEVPLTKDGSLLQETFKEAEKGTFKGVIGHYHCKKTKKDPASLEMDKVVHELKADEDVLDLDVVAKLMRNL